MSQSCLPPDPAIAEQAATWFVRLHDQACSADERAAFETWRQASDAHRLEYDQFCRLWSRLDGLAPKRRGARKTVAASLAGLGLAAALASQWPETIDETYATAIGEHRHVRLADGTEVDINAGTRLRARITAWSRQLTVEEGEVLVAVAPSWYRPLAVAAGEGMIHDIGTTFDVARRNDRVTVTVLEGRVDVRLKGQAALGVTLTAGKQTRYWDGRIEFPRNVDVSAVSAWRDGRWIFVATPLDEVIAGMNQQHRHATTLAAPELKSLKVSGVFNMADQTGLIRALTTLFPLDAVEQDGVTRLQRRPRS